MPFRQFAKLNACQQFCGLSALSHLFDAIRQESPFCSDTRNRPEWSLSSIDQTFDFWAIRPCNDAAAQIGRSRTGSFR
jgi:hypothetical protein